MMERDPGTRARGTVAKPRNRRHAEGRHVASEAERPDSPVPQPDEPGQIGAYVGAVADIAERKETEEHLTFLAEAGAVLSSSRDLEATLQRVARLAVARLAGWCVVDLVDSDGQLRRVAAAHADAALDRDAREPVGRYSPAGDRPHPVWQVLRTGQPHVQAEVPDVLLSALAHDAEHLELLRRLEIGSLMAVPLIAHGRVLGALTFVVSRSSRRYGAADLRLAQDLAGRCAVAIENARLYAAEQHARAAAERAADRVAHLQAVTAALSGTLTPDQVAEVILDQAVAALGAQAGTVALLTESGTEMEVLCAPGFAPEVVERWRRFPVTTPALLAEVIRTGQPIWVESANAVTRYPALVAIQATEGVGAMAALPLLAGDRPIGGLGLTFPEERTFDDQDRAFALTLAEACAQAVERARLYEAERLARATAERQAAERVAILGQVADGVIVADATGRVTFMNRAVRDLFGLGGREMATDAATDTYQLLTPAGEPYDPEDVPLARAALRGEAVPDAEWRIRRPDGREIIVQGSATPVLAEDGTRLGAVLTLRDVTVRRELERQKEEFFANASHDLRTPIATIKASIEVVLENEPAGTPEPLHRLLVNINHEADRMATLVDDLLDLTRLEAGRLRLRCAPCDLRALAERSARAIESLARRRGQRVVLDLPKRPISATVDAERLERALLNLLTNAHKYGRDGGTICLSLERRPRELVFAVADDGPGMPEADRVRIFERFYRPKREASRRSQGSGLGLPIAKAMVELHGGRIWVESRPGAGTTVRIALPTGGRQEAAR